MSRRPSSRKTRTRWTRWLVLILVGCALSMVTLGSIAWAEEVVIRMYAGAYTPRERTQSDRWDPPSYLKTLAEQYTQMHPHVKIEFLPEITPVDRFDTWLLTQYQALRGPDVGTQLFSDVNRHYLKGWYVNLAPYLERPNPYVQGNERWKDIFQPGVIATGMAPDGNMYVLPTGVVGTAIYYNKDIFARAGVDVPTTWEEFMEVQRKIASIGRIPFAFHMAGAKYATNWSLRVIQDMILDSKLPEIKGTGEPVLRTMIEGEGISQKELVAAIMSGTYSAKDPQWQEQLRLLKEWSAYWGPGYLSLDPDGAYRLFVTGQAAMLYDNSGRLKILESDSLRRFEFGTFDFPRITQESSPYATGVSAPAVGGYTGDGSFTVAATTLDQGTTDQVIDWLMFITAPQNYIPMANDLGWYSPGLVDLEGVDPRLEPFIRSVENGVFRIESFYRGLTVEFADQFYQVLQEFLAGRKSMDVATDEIQRYMERAADELIERNGWFDLLGDQ